MPDVIEVTRRAYVTRQLLARRALLAVRRQWARVDPEAISLSWRATVGPAVLATITSAQVEAASTADATVTAQLEAQGISATEAGLIDARLFGGVASDGRPLDTLLDLARRYSLHQVSTGSTPAQGLAVGGQFLDMVTGTQVSDASRAAVSVATTTRRAVTGSYRVLTPPSCSRCIVLAGKWSPAMTAFERHPRCDCTSLPSGRYDLDDEPRLWRPESAFDAMSTAEQDATFGKAGAQAIRDGAGVGSVVNARSGMYSAADGRRMTRTSARTGPRLMPEQIYRDAEGDRAEAIRLLRMHGYIR